MRSQLYREKDNENITVFTEKSFAVRLIAISNKVLKILNRKHKIVFNLQDIAHLLK